ncbi:MAG: gliding motility-associated C-terminal domain-containing protein [Bacteroidia bacterium]
MKNINPSKWFFLLIFLPAWTSAQNLVTNPGFEQYSSLPDLLSGWPLVSGWTNAGNGITTPDYYHQGSTSNVAGLPNSQFARIFPFADSAIMGYYAYETLGTISYREYLQTRLITPLVPGVAYRVSLALSNGKTIPPPFGGTNGAGVLLSAAPVSQNSYGPAFTGPINISPDWNLPEPLWDSGWQVFSFIYIPDVPDEYLTIGNFLPDTATKKYHISGSIPGHFASYMYVDEVSVVPTIAVSGTDTICAGDTAYLSATLAPSWHWLASGHALADSVQHIAVSPATTTTYQVIRGNDTASHTVFVIPLEKPDLGPDTTICMGESITLNASLDFGLQYHWQDGSSFPVVTVSQAGTYHVDVVHACGFFSDTLNLSVLSPPEIQLGADTTLCPGETLTLTATSGVVWEDFSRDSIRILTHPGLYYGQIQNACGFATDSIFIRRGLAASLDLGNDTLICEGEAIILDAGQDGEAAYLWSDGSDGPTLLVTRPDIYSVRVTTYCGVWRDQITVNVLSPPEVNLGNDTLLCEDRNPALLLNAYQPFSSYLWQDGSTKPIYEASLPGYYTVTVSNACGITSDEITINYELCDCYIHFPNAFSPNEDGINETFGAIMSCRTESWSMVIFDRWGKKIVSSENPDYQWDGRFKGGDCPEGVYVWKVRYHTPGHPIVEKGGTVTLFR